MRLSQMNKHLRYLKYVLKHKWYVFVWCRRYGIPLAGIVHDLSKFSPKEWSPYVNYFYGDSKDQRGFDAAWNHHQKANPHHWQYWVLREDSGGLKLLDMPERYRLEMLADWRGAGMAITGKDDTRNWYLKNRENMLLHPATLQWVESELGIE